MIVGTVKETYPGERRIALTPHVLPLLSKAGCEVLIEAGAGTDAGFPDDSYTEKGARTASSRKEVFDAADVLLQVRAYGANLEQGRADLELMREGQVLLGTFEPLTSLDAAREIASRGVTLFAMELMPRITRAQSMDVLSSMATIAGYKGVLLAAEQLPKMFPMMMTAAGTVKPARVLILGAGVAGLQAIASSRRLGAHVSAYDIRAEVKEQIESLGGKFVELDLETGDSQDAGGYAKAMGEEFYKRQRELLGKVIAENDVLITTAAVPGKRAPLLVTAEMARGMATGSVIVDLAAERGGNCELTRPGETVVESGVTILGPLNLPASVPHDASQMYSKNLVTLVQLMVKEGRLELDMEDEVITGTMVTHKGEITNEQVRGAMGAAASPA